MSTTPGPTRKSNSNPSSPSLTGPVARFMVLSLAAVVLLAFLSAMLIRNLARDEAVRNSSEVTAAVGRATIEPLLTPALFAGDPAAIRAVDDAVQRHVLGNDVARVKLWTQDGLILYSDEPRLIGKRFPLEEEDAAALRDGRVTADFGTPDKEENLFEQGQGKLLQVYVPLKSNEGKPVLYEMYRHSSSVLSDTAWMWRTFLPIALVTVLLLWATQGPLALQMARKIRAGSEERERLLSAAVDASMLERRRVAADLHDGTIQHLAGVAYELEAGADEQPPTDAGIRASDALRHGAVSIRHCIRQLRALVVEITPPSLRTGGLEAALTDVVAPLSMRGMETDLTLDKNLRVDPETEALLLRGAQEAVRNAVKHSEAEHVAVSVVQREDVITLEVADDGRGFDADDVSRAREDGHVGLRLLEDLVRDRGGALDVTGRPGEGTTMRMTVPI